MLWSPEQWLGRICLVQGCPGTWLETPQISLFAYPNIAGPAEFFAHRKETETEMGCHFRRLCTVVSFIACRLPSMLTYLHFIPFHAACDIAVSKAFPFCLQHLFCACNIYVYVPTHHHSKEDEKKQKSSSIFIQKFNQFQTRLADQGIPGWPWVPELPGHSVSA